MRKIKQKDIVLKTIFIFKDGELIGQPRYRTKKQAYQEYRAFLKVGYLDFKTGEAMEGVTFELA